MAVVHEVTFQCLIEMAAVKKNIYPCGPQLTEKAKEIASVLGKNEFKASNGWLEKWNKLLSVVKLLMLLEKQSSLGRRDCQN